MRKDFFFPPKNDHDSQMSNLPTIEITQKTMDYPGGLVRRKAAAKLSKIRGGKARRRRYVKQGSRWYSNTITWNIPSGGWSSQLSNSEVNSTLTKAFRIWAEISPLVFRWVDPPTQADITIKFATGKERNKVRIVCRTLLFASFAFIIGDQITCRENNADCYFLLYRNNFNKSSPQSMKVEEKPSEKYETVH